MAKPEIKPTRRNKRVLLVLLTGAANLSCYPIWRLAGSTAGRVYLILATLEDAGWVTGEWEAGIAPGSPRRRFFSLTWKGCVKAMEMLGLEIPGSQCLCTRPGRTGCDHAGQSSCCCGKLGGE